MSAHSRNKGHGFERDIAIALRQFFPNAKRHLEYQGAEAKGFDLDNTGHLKIQCKRGQTYSPIVAIEEVQSIFPDIPALITKADHKPAVICLYLSDFVRILKDAESIYTNSDLSPKSDGGSNDSKIY